MKERPKTKKNIANPGNKAVHQIPVGRAESARLRSLPHSGTSAGTPKPKKPKLPNTKTASAAFNVIRIGNGVITFGNIYFNTTLNDWAKFDINKRTKFDAAISSGLAIMACNKNLYAPRAEKILKNKVTFSFSKYNNKGNISKIIQ